MEVFKYIKGYEGLYQVSNLGRVKSLEKVDSLGHLRKEKILKPYNNGSGYLLVRLWKNNNYKNYYVHRMVAEAFLDNPDGLPQVNHKNEDKTDNRVENLEFCSAKYNTNYGTGNQRRSEKQINGLQSKPVYQYTLDGEFVKEYSSVSEVERQLGYANQNISCCCLGKYKTAYSFIWKYKTPE